MATYLTSGNDGYAADGGEIVHALEGNDQIHIIHVDDSGFLGYDFDFFAPAAASLTAYYPVFKPMQITERWAGAIDATPDAVPVISKLDKIEGLYLCTGFSGHGFGLGPGAGKLMAEIVTGETPCVDPGPFRYGRFFDGSNPRPTTGL